MDLQELLLQLLVFFDTIKVEIHHQILFGRVDVIDAFVVVRLIFDVTPKIKLTLVSSCNVRTELATSITVAYHRADSSSSK